MVTTSEPGMPVRVGVWVVFLLWHSSGEFELTFKDVLLRSDGADH